MGRRSLFAVVVLIAVAGCSAVEPDQAPQSAPTSAPVRSSGAQDGVTKSDNITIVANVPLEAPFDGKQSWGTDLAFQGKYAYVGNYDGFSVVDIGKPEKPQVTSRVLCPGGQNDISVHGDLLILSVDEPRSDDTCASRPTSPGGKRPWEGLRVFDISDKARPKYVTSVATECGSHTHALIAGEDVIHVYVSSPGPDPRSATCKAPHDGLDIVEISLKDPEKAKIVASPRVFAERKIGDDDQGFSARGCHDITVYAERDLAAAACFGDGLLLDVSDPVAPKVLQLAQDPNFAIWHSATFNNDGTRVVFSDELGGGMAATCDETVDSKRGADAVYDIVGGKTMKHAGYYKIPRAQEAEENCVAHNGSLIPVPGKDIMVQAWYQGGVSVWDFTDPAKAREIAFFERSRVDGLAGSWSAYYYNGYIYSSDITLGLDVLRLDDPLTDPAKKIVMKELNAQSQRAY